MISAAEVQTMAAAVPIPRHVLQAIAHELRQPLSAIESTAYYLGLVLPRGNDRARDHVARLRQLVEQSNWILSCGLQLTDDTPLAPERVDLEEFITESVAVAITPGAPLPALALAGNLPPVRLDPARGRALVSNVLTLFQQISEGDHCIDVKTERDGDGVAMCIAVNVQGRTSEAALGPGSTLCLSSVRRTVDAHGGTLTIEVDPQDGVHLRVVFAAY
jgi:signal transduction histidine kinase